MANPYWLTEIELGEIKGPQGQKSVAAQMFGTGFVDERTVRLNVLYEDGTIELAWPAKKQQTHEAIARVELLHQKARRLGVDPRPHQRVRGRRCRWCELPRRLCLCFLLESAQMPVDTQRVWTY
jgi:hypothetical protein